MPELMPVTMPVPEPIVAIRVLLLVQVPPGVESVRVMAVPTQRTVAGPVITAGKVVTVTVFVTLHPEAVV